MKKSKIDNFPESGLKRKEAIAKLQREGHDVTFEQQRKHEALGLIHPYRSPDRKIRIYSLDNLETMRRISGFRDLDFSLQRIKRFFDLENKILSNNLICKREIDKDPETGEITYIREMPPATAVNPIQYERLRVLVDEYNLICDEIKEKSNKKARIMANLEQDTSRRQKEIDRMTTVKDD